MTKDDIIRDLISHLTSVLGSIPIGEMNEDLRQACVECTTSAFIAIGDLPSDYLHKVPKSDTFRNK